MNLEAASWLLIAMKQFTDWRAIRSDHWPAIDNRKKQQVTCSQELFENADQSLLLKSVTYSSFYSLTIGLTKQDIGRLYCVEVQSAERDETAYIMSPILRRPADISLQSTVYLDFEDTDSIYPDSSAISASVYGGYFDSRLDWQVIAGVWDPSSDPLKACTYIRDNDYQVLKVRFDTYYALERTRHGLIPLLQTVNDEIPVVYCIRVIENLVSDQKNQPISVAESSFILQADGVIYNIEGNTSFAPLTPPAPE